MYLADYYVSNVEDITEALWVSRFDCQIFFISGSHQDKPISNAEYLMLLQTNRDITDFTITHEINMHTYSSKTPG